MFDRNIQEIAKHITAEALPDVLREIVDYRSEIAKANDSDPYEYRIDHVGTEIVNRHGSMCREFAVSITSEKEQGKFYKIHWVLPLIGKINDPKPFVKCVVEI